MRQPPIPPSPSRWPTGLRVLAAAGLAALTLGFSACEKKEAAADGPKTAADAAGLQKILDLGFARQDIVDGGTSYVVEGDITFDKQRLATGRPYPNARAGKAKGQEKQASTNALIDYWKQPYITVHIDWSFPDYWRGDVEQAVEDWNSIEGSRVDLTLTDDEQADITIKGDDLRRGTFGYAQFPSDGNPGYEVVINRQDRDRTRNSIQQEAGWRQAAKGSTPGATPRRTAYGRLPSYPAGAGKGSATPRGVAYMIRGF